MNSVDSVMRQVEPKLVPAVPDGDSPFIVEFFMVRGFGFRCMAYQDQAGKWRSAFDGLDLPGHVLTVE